MQGHISLARGTGCTACCHVAASLLAWASVWHFVLRNTQRSNHLQHGGTHPCLPGHQRL